MKQVLARPESGPGVAERSRTLVAAAFVGGLGLLLLWTAGFAHSETLHEAAHDGRHAFAFPCH